ncbi:hypothetical protein [Phycicoccus sp. SLBN-51]|uniref:hypothetical protein n=1 Tax=Phycicoccus sp. SLBN-51 TaxID=2768447 RepID=UPI00117178EF|nr:hypothetical protein [Phycicoccus sp. SLBN-51]TQJ49913.1 hypothetical protein FBY26_1608 [Phycicoccus sp. SLBN-51]
MTDQPAAGDQTSISERAQEVSWVTGTPLRGAPLHSAAPLPTAEACTEAAQSAAALRAGVVVPGPEGGLQKLASAVKRAFGGR